MLVTANLVSYAVLLGVLALLVLAVRGGRRRQAVDARLLAQATGHPSTGLPRGLSPAQCAEVARDTADLLAAAGMVSERRSGGAVVVARAMDGEYLLDVAADYIRVTHHSNAGTVTLGKFAGSCAAVRAVAGHARASTG